MTTKPMTTDQKVAAYRGMAAATVGIVRNIVEEGAQDIAGIDAFEPHNAAITVLEQLALDIKSGKIPLERLEALVWVASPVKIDLTSRHTEAPSLPQPDAKS